MNDQEWSKLSYAMKNHQLYLRQKEILEKFLERNAISRAQYEKSLHDMTVRMHEG